MLENCVLYVVAEVVAGLSKYCAELEPKALALVELVYPPIISEVIKEVAPLSNLTDNLVSLFCLPQPLWVKITNILLVADVGVIVAVKPVSE